MNQTNRDTYVKRVFSDPKNYPYGFSRSGDFSISESRALSQFGALIAALVDGHLAPETEEDKGYLAAALGKRPALSLAEKAWVKYQRRINRPKAASICGASNVKPDNSDEVEDDDSSDLSLSVDDDLE